MVVLGGAERSSITAGCLALGVNCKAGSGLDALGDRTDEVLPGSTALLNARCIIPPVERVGIINVAGASGAGGPMVSLSSRPSSSSDVVDVVPSSSELALDWNGSDPDVTLEEGRDETDDQDAAVAGGRALTTFFLLGDGSMRASKGETKSKMLFWAGGAGLAGVALLLLDDDTSACSEPVATDLVAPEFTTGESAGVGRPLDTAWLAGGAADGLDKANDCIKLAKWALSLAAWSS